MVKASAYNAGDLGLIPGLGRSPGEGNSSPLQYCCLENPMDRGAWQAAVHGVAKGWTRLSNFTFTLFLKTSKDRNSLSPQKVYSFQEQLEVLFLLVLNLPS